MLTLAVGKPLPFQMPPGIRLHYFLEANTLMLVMNIPEPSSEEVAGARRGVLDMRFLACEIGLLCLFRFTPGFPWCDAPFEWHRDPSLAGQLPTEGVRQSLMVALADCARNEVRSVRLMQLPENTGGALYRALKMQAEHPMYEPSKAELWFRGLQFQSTASLAELAAGHIEPTIGSEGMMRFTFRDRGKA